jgi:hypothetical protein
MCYRLVSQAAVIGAIGRGTSRFLRGRLVPVEGIEPPTFGLQNQFGFLDIKAEQLVIAQLSQGFIEGPFGGEPLFLCRVL